MLTNDEQLQWESEKYSNRVASVMVLDSGRAVVAHQGLIIHAVTDETGIWQALKEITEMPHPEYVPPARRSRAGISSVVTEEEMMALLKAAPRSLKNVELVFDQRVKEST